MPKLKSWLRHLLILGDIFPHFSRQQVNYLHFYSRRSGSEYPMTRK